MVGDTVQLHAGGSTARLLPAAGGRVSGLRLARRGGGVVEVLHPYPEDFFDPLRWAKGGIYPLMPYSNRVAGARVQVQGQAFALAPHPDALPHTLHGNAHALPWRMRSQASDGALMVLDAPPSAAWPWHYTGSMQLQLRPSELAITLEIRNAGTSVMPAGLGLHPYLRHRPDARVGYRATTAWPATPDFLAVASRPLRDGERYSPARVLPAGGLTDYVGGWDGIADIDLPEAGTRLRIAADPLFGHLVVHRPDSQAYLCLEPVSHVADGFNLAARGVADTGTRLLAPGETLEGTIRFQLLEDAA